MFLYSLILAIVSVGLHLAKSIRLGTVDRTLVFSGFSELCVYKDGLVWGRGNSCTSPRILWYHENALSLITRCVCVSLTVLPTYTRYKSSSQESETSSNLPSIKTRFSHFLFLLWCLTALRKTQSSWTQFLEDFHLTTNTVMTSTHTEMDICSGRGHAETWRHVVIWQLIVVKKIKELWLELLKLS